MRNLTIRRTKSFVACMAKAKVYIEDATSGEININGVSCRILGVLKNGEEKTFPIGDEAVKVFVIADKLSRNYCNEYYQITAGQEDIVLTGQNKFNLATGNSFVFDNNNSEDVLANRKKNARKGIVILAVAAIVGFAVGFLLTSGFLFGNEPEVKRFSSDGFSIMLTDEFQKESAERYHVAYASKDVVVLVLKEEFDLAEGFEDYTLDQYLDLILQANQLSTENIKRADGLTGFVYNSTNADKDYCYFSYVYKSADAFWTVQFAVLAQNAEEYEAQITEWAKSVEFIYALGE